MFDNFISILNIPCCEHGPPTSETILKCLLIHVSTINMSDSGCINLYVFSSGFLQLEYSDD